MQYLFLLFIGAPLITFALSSRKKLVYYILATAAIPVTMFMPSTVFFDFIGGVNAQAAYLFLIFIALIIAALRTRERSLGRLRVLFPFVLFLVFAAASLLWSGDSIHGLRFLIKLLTPTLMLFVASSVLASDQDLKTAQRMMLLCCFVVLGVAIVNLALGGGIGGQEIRLKWLARGYLAAPYMGPAPFSFLMSIGAIICLSRYMAYRDLPNGVMAGVLLLAIVMAFTRISLGGIVVASGACSLVLARTALVRYVVPALLVVSFIAMTFLYQPLYSRMFFENSNVGLSTTLAAPENLARAINSSGRTALWEAAFEEFRDFSAYGGGGLGSTDGWLNAKEGREQLHSGYLTLFFDLGIVGLGLFVFALANAVVWCYQINFAVPYKRGKIHQACSVAGLIFYAITLVTDNSINYVTEIGIYVFALLAISVVVARRERQSRRRLSYECAHGLRSRSAGRISVQHYN